MTASPLAGADWRALVAAIRTRPDDDTPRLVAADWLDDAGDTSLSAWAELIRVQVEAVRAVGTNQHPPVEWCDCPGCRADRRTAMLHEQHGAAWHVHQFGHVETGVPFVAANLYERGFPIHLQTQIVVSYLVWKDMLATIMAACWSVFVRSPIVSAAFRITRPGTLSRRVSVAITPRQPKNARDIAVRVTAHHQLHGFDAVTANRVGTARSRTDRLVRGAVREVLRTGVAL